MPSLLSIIFICSNDMVIAKTHDYNFNQTNCERKNWTQANKTKQATQKWFCYQNLVLLLTPFQYTAVSLECVLSTQTYSFWWNTPRASGAEVSHMFTNYGRQISAKHSPFSCDKVQDIPHYSFKSTHSTMPTRMTQHISRMTHVLKRWCTAHLRHKFRVILLLFLHSSLDGSSPAIPEMH